MSAQNIFDAPPDHLSEKDFHERILLIEKEFTEKSDTYLLKKNYILAIRARLTSIEAEQRNTRPHISLYQDEIQFRSTLSIYPFHFKEDYLNIFLLERRQQQDLALFKSHVNQLYSWLEKMQTEKKEAENKANSIQDLRYDLNLFAEFSKKWDHSNSQSEINRAKALLDCYSTNSLLFFPKRKYAKIIEQIKSQCGADNEITTAKHLLGVLIGIDSQNRNQLGHLQAIIAVLASKVLPLQESTERARNSENSALPDFNNEFLNLSPFNA